MTYKLLDPEKRKSVWLDDLERGVAPLNHFYYCYLSDDPDMISVAIRMKSCVYGEEVYFHCPMLGEMWVGDLGYCDFRPTLWKRLELQAGVPPPVQDLCILSPYGLTEDFLTNVSRKGTYDVSDAFWLPPRLH